MNKSFTLIEILVVIVVIGVLSAFILVGMSSISQKANFAKGQAFINSMDNALLLGRVSQWKLDQVTGTNPATTSDSWNSNTGTLYDGASTACVFGGSSTVCPQPVTSGCPSGNCLSFDGSNDYVRVLNNTTIDIKDKISIGAWIYPGGPIASVQDIVCKDAQSTYHGYEFRINTNMLEFRINPTSSSYTYRSSSSNNFALNVWYYVSVSYDGTNITFYKDGQSFYTVAANGQLYNSSCELRIGTYTVDGNFYFNGLMDDVRIYNQAIPTSQIQQNYFLGLNNLYKNKGLTKLEYIQRLGELKNNLSQSNQ
jgi:prepilin-type N-terminal cleavage/methylation domain-containing protein